MNHVALYGLVLTAIISTNLLGLAIVRVCFKRRMPLEALARAIVIGVVAASVGFWGVDIIKLIFGG